MKQYVQERTSPLEVLDERESRSRNVQCATVGGIVAPEYRISSSLPALSLVYAVTRRGYSSVWYLARMLLREERGRGQPACSPDEALQRGERPALGESPGPPLANGAQSGATERESCDALLPLLALVVVVPPRRGRLVEGEAEREGAC